MTSMRMRFLFSLSFVHVLVRYIGGEGEWGGGDDVHANATFVFSFFCSRAGAVHWWGGGVGGGVMTSMRMRLLFSLSFVHVLVRYIVEATKASCAT